MYITRPLIIGFVIEGGRPRYLDGRAALAPYRDIAVIGAVIPQRADLYHNLFFARPRPTTCSENRNATKRYRIMAPNCFFQKRLLLGRGSPVHFGATR